MQPNLAEAERRIEEARRTQADSLDLGDLALRELPASLGDLPHLKVLCLGRQRLTEAGGLEGDSNRLSPEFTDLAPLAGLQALQSLNLSSCQGVTDLTSIAGLQALQILDLQSCMGVKDLAPISGLQALQSLNLQFCIGVTDLTPIAGLQALQILDLSSTDVTDLTPIAGLQALQNLDLSSTGVTDLTPIAGLQALQILSLPSTGVTDLTPIAGLQALQNLDLSRTGVTDLTPIAGLQVLQNLDLSSTGVTDLTPIAGLQALQILYLQNCTGLTDLTPIAGLQALQILYLWRTGVTDLTPIAGLQALQNLSLSSTGVTDLTPIAGLQALQNLDLWSTGVTDLTPIAGLQALQILYLQNCTGVTDLTPIAGLQALQNLYLQDCTGVTDLTPIAGLQALQILNLYGCRPAVPTALLRVFADHLHLDKLIVDEAVNVPREVLSHKENDHCLPRLHTYFSELDLGAEAENEVKVILLGNGRVGKTQLCRRFRGQPFDESVQSTHGIQIWREELRIQTGGQEQAFQINWWDFGGQDIYHGTHALFLRSRAVFLILWTPRLENRNEYDENGIPLRNQPLAYWLDYVRTLAGEDSPVIVVQSQCDRFADQLSAPPRPDGFGWFQCCACSAKTDLGKDPLEAQLREAIRYLLDRNGKLEIGRGRAKARRRLYEWRSEDQKRNPEERQHRTLALDEFQALCDEAGGIASWEHALDYFHHTGVVFYRPDLFSNCIVLDQDWALDAVYTVFHRGRAVPLLRDSGRFTRADLALIAWEKHSVEEQRLFLGLMQSCGVCFPCGKTAQGEARYIAPDLLPRFEAVSGRLHAWKEEPGTPMLRLEYRFFHPAIIRGLMSEIGQQAGDLAEYWKYGLWFKDGRRDSQLLVRFVDTSTNDAPGAGALELKAQGRDPLGLLREIRKAILWQKIGEKPEELLTLDGTTVARSDLDSLMDDGRVLDLRRKLVSGAAFTAFFEDREHVPDEILATGKTPGIDIDPQPLTPNEKPREVFISYAWGDDTPEGKTRTEVVEGLHAALEKDGLQPVRDRDQIQNGELISAFIRRLTRADLVVAVISDKYLRSPYCMFEILSLWQKSQKDADLMAERLVPIVLPEVKIGSLQERLLYVDFWDAQAERLEKLARKTNFLRLSGDSLEEARLVLEFAHHVDKILVFLKDVLMPNKLEAHLDDGFKAVRDALRRRLADS